MVETQGLVKEDYAGETPNPVEVKIVENQFRKFLANNGRAKTTVRSYVIYIKLLIHKGADVFNPESVKETIATQTWDTNTKRTVVNVYTTFSKSIGKAWEKPQYKHEHKQVFIPTDREREIAVSSGYGESIAFARFLDETGCRCNETERLEWTDLDTERCKATIKASKNGNARTLSISRELMDRLLRLPRKWPTVFSPKALNTRRVLFRKRMQRLARVHNNPRFLKIHFHTLRHCRALREYHKTHSILHVKKVLGHRSILTTQRYVELYTEIYGDLKPEDYICEIASTVKEAKRLIEAGFEYVSEIDGVQLYRKVK